MRYLAFCAAATALVASMFWFPPTGKYLLSKLTVSLPLPKADAIIVLAGSYQERCTAAAVLFKAGNAPKIILTDDRVRRGWSHQHQRNLYSIERSEEMLLELGVPRESIVRLPFHMSGTIYDALAVREYLKSSNLHRITLVTSDYHTRRALWTFRKVLSGRQVEVGVTPAKGADLRMLDLIRESIKFFWYVIRYGPVGRVPTLN